MASGYLRTDTWLDAVGSLETAQEFCASVTLDVQRWKWVVISVHSAVQGFMALSLEQGNSIQVLRDDIAAKWLKAHEAGTAYPDEKMDFFLGLYDKIKSDDVARYFGGKKFVPGATHDYSLRKLNELRNDWLHFLPKGWSVELSGLPSICLDSLDVVSFLGWESGTIIWHEPSLADRASCSISILRGELQAIRGIYLP